jgi:hypothetical protein
MQYTDSITKGFLTGRGAFYNLNFGEGLSPEARNAINDERKGLTRWDEYEDPTYLGFYFRFLPHTTFTSNIDLDYLPQGLFLGADDVEVTTEQASGAGGGAPGTVTYHPDSAVSFLRRRGEYYRSDMMTEFIQGMMHLSRKTPWVFEKVSGLSDIWKIDPKINWRGKEKKLIFECTESINMRMTYLIDLYRKAAFDAEYMRYMLPETQRYFSMELVITEIRTMQRSGGVLWEPATFLSFQFDYCEFDFFSEAPMYLESPTRYAQAGQEAPTVKIPIKIGKVRESNSYGLLGALLSDTWSTYSRGRDAANKSFTQDTTVKSGSGSDLESSVGYIAGLKNTTYNDDRVKREDAFRQSPGNAYGNPPRADLGLLGQVATGALASLQSAAQNLANRALLGNVYGLSIGTLAGQLGGILNNPIAAVQGIASNFSTNQQQATAIAQNVSLSGPDVKLINDFVGAVNYVQQTIPGINLQELTVGDAITGINPSQNLQGSASNAGLLSNGSNINGSPSQVQLDAPSVSQTLPGQETLTGPNIMGSVLGKILFEGLGSSEGNPGKTVLSGPASTLSGNPGDVDLTSPRIPEGGGKVNLTAPTVEPSSASKVELIEPIKPGGTLGTESLDSNGGSLKGEPDRISLEAPPVSTKLQGSVELESAPKEGGAGPSKVRLVSPESGPEERPGNAELESPPKKDGELGNVELE